MRVHVHVHIITMPTQCHAILEGFRVCLVHDGLSAHAITSMRSPKASTVVLLFALSSL